MTYETKEQVAFMAASMINLTNMMDMPESGLPYVTDWVGLKTIRKLMGIDWLHYKVSFEEMAEDICIISDWDSALATPRRTDSELSQMGRQIADLVEDTSPVDEDVAETMFAVLTWEGLGAWLEANKE